MGAWKSSGMDPRTRQTNNKGKVGRENVSIGNQKTKATRDASTLEKSHEKVSRATKKKKKKSRYQQKKKLGRTGGEKW